jgi:tRNA C32,U32 (ribose-2'-O)-methylase TrmJ
MFTRFFDGLIQAILEEFAQFYEEYLSFRDPIEAMYRSLRLLYGRGEIDTGQFIRLRNKIRRGQLIQGELQMLHCQAELCQEAKGKFLADRHPRLARGLDRVYLDLALLKEIRIDQKEILEKLDSEGSWVASQAEAVRQEAQAALPNEIEARALLDTWQDLLQLSHVFERRKQVLQQNLRRLDALEARLRTYEAELTVLDSQEYLQGLQMRIHQDLTLGGPH